MFSPKDGCTDGADRKAHDDLPLIQWYIQQVADYKKANNVQLVDVVDVHFYPQAPGVFSKAEDPLTALLRLRSPRSLWDPTYNDESWISTPIMILKRINDWITSINPGMKTAVSEYNFGDDTLITAALANTNAIGVFAQMGVQVATRWVAPASGSIAEEAFKIYLNYDGKGSRVTGDYVQTTSSNIDLVSAFAFNSQSTKKIYVVIINNVNTGANPVTVDVSDFSQTGSINYFSFATGQPIKPTGTGTVSAGTFSYSAPAWSATLAVVSY
jgi:hypothetical protein